jgi:hypothetical protein
VFYIFGLICFKKIIIIIELKSSLCWADLFLIGLICCCNFIFGLLRYYWPFFFLFFFCVICGKCYNFRLFRVFKTKMRMDTLWLRSMCGRLCN